MTMSDNDQLLLGADGPDMAPVHQPSVMSRIRNYFLTGLIVAGPVAVTLWLIWSFVTWVDNWVRPFIPVELPARNLSAGKNSRLWADHRLHLAHIARVSDS